MFIKNILIKQKSMCQSKSAHTLHIFTATQPQTLVICYCSCCGGSGGGMRVSLAICSSCSGSVVVVDTLPPQIVTSSLWDNLSKFANVSIFNSFLI